MNGWGSVVADLNEQTSTFLMKIIQATKNSDTIIVAKNTSCNMLLTQQDTHTVRLYYNAVVYSKCFYTQHLAVLWFSAPAIVHM